MFTKIEKIIIKIFIPFLIDLSKMPRKFKNNKGKSVLQKGHLVDENNISPGQISFEMA